MDFDKGIFSLVFILKIKTHAASAGGIQTLRRSNLPYIALLQPWNEVPGTKARKNALFIVSTQKGNNQALLKYNVIFFTNW